MQRPANPSRIAPVPGCVRDDPGRPIAATLPALSITGEAQVATFGILYTIGDSLADCCFLRRFTRGDPPPRVHLLPSRIDAVNEPRRRRRATRHDEPAALSTSGTATFWNWSLSSTGSGAVPMRPNSSPPTGAET